MKTFYLVMAIIGTVIPWFFFGSFFVTNGIDVILFIESLFSTEPATAFSADILISIVIFLVWSYRDAQSKGIKRWWLVLPATACVGLSLALPLYLYFRETA